MMRWTKGDVFLVVLMGVMIAGILFAWLTPADGAVKVRTKSVHQVVRGIFVAQFNDGSWELVKRCRYEDSSNCWWDAQRRGNGSGRSFVNVDGTPRYLTKHARVHYLLIK